MSLLEAIKSKKVSLKSNETRITTVSGQIILEKSSATGEKFQVILNEASPGFVIDQVPDMQVAFMFQWLCLGSQDVVVDEKVLHMNKITHILSLGVKPPVQFPDIAYKFLPIYDEPGYIISNHFPDCFAYIDQCQSQSSTVFVHCNAGVSRSATVVIAYVMKHLGVGRDEALAMVKLARPCIKPNPGFMIQIKVWEETMGGKGCS